MSEHTDQLRQEAAWMAAKLTETREIIADEPLVTVYTDSNGNERSKPNPAYTAYEALLASFIKALRALAEAGDEPELPEDFNLDSIRITVNPLKAAGQ